jgi:hypothetical protein
MNGANFVPSILAALTATPATPAPDAIRDIAPPVDVFPYPLWMVALAGLIALLLLGLLVWVMVKWLRTRPPPPLPSPEAIALRELESLRSHVHDLDPYAFSFAVSDVLRTFISKAKFRLPATQQTSPEFLAAISGSSLFSEKDRTLLGRFLEKCDMIKFARIEATSADNTELVESALDFVRGGEA